LSQSIAEEGIELTVKRARTGGRGTYSPVTALGIEHPLRTQVRHRGASGEAIDRRRFTTKLNEHLNGSGGNAGRTGYL
jgi:hypothetical protein